MKIADAVVAVAQQTTAQDLLISKNKSLAQLHRLLHLQLSTSSLVGVSHVNRQ